MAGCAAWVSALQLLKMVWPAAAQDTCQYILTHLCMHGVTVKHYNLYNTRRALYKVMQGLEAADPQPNLDLADCVRMHICESSAAKQRLTQQQQNMLCMDLRGRSLQVTYFWQTSANRVILATFTQLSEQRACTLHME